MLTYLFLYETQAAMVIDVNASPDCLQFSNNQTCTAYQTILFCIYTVHNGRLSNSTKSFQFDLHIIIDLTV